MPKVTKEKVTLSPEAYKALEVEAMLRGTTLKDAASKLILKAACPKCKEILEVMDRPPRKDATTEVSESHREEEPKVPIVHIGTTIDLKNPSGTGHKGTSAQVSKGQMAQEPKGHMAQTPKSIKAILSKDPVALAKLKELYAANPRPSLAMMGKEIGYPKGTVNDNIKRMKERREL